MNTLVIPIFFCTDNEYSIPTYIALYSLLNNHRSNELIHAYMLVPEDFSEKNECLLRELSGDKCLVDFFKVSNDYDKVSINSPHVSSTTMYRLLIPRIVRQRLGNSIDKCLFIDSDIVVERDISDLYYTDIDEYCIAGVLDRALSGKKYSESKGYEKHRQSLAIPSLNQYINAGILLINLREIEKLGLENKLESAGYRDDYRYNDQDVINSVFYGSIKHIPLRFNAMTTCLYQNTQEFYDQYGLQNVREAQKNPVILHYILGRKPWSCKNMMYANNWWKYVKMQDDDITKDYIQPFLISHKAPFCDRVRETAKTVVIKVGIYNLLRNAYYSMKK